MSSNNYRKSRQYSRIPFQTRKELIRLVMEQKLTIKQSCEKLHINYSTGKLTVKKFQKEGRITKFADEMNGEQKKIENLEKQQKKIKKQSLFNQKQYAKQNYNHQQATNQSPLPLYIPFGCEFFYQPIMFQYQNLADFNGINNQPFSFFYWNH